MFVCEECFHEFDEPAVWTEEHGETLSGCPRCRGNFVESDEINRCKICGEPIDDDEVCCASCKAEVVSRFERMLSEFEPEEIEVLNHVYEGKDLDAEVL